MSREEQLTDLGRAYRAWMGRRLALLVPGALGALAAGVWFLFRDPCPVALRVPSMVLAATFAGLQAYLALRTVRVVRDRTRLPRQVARTRRREMGPVGLVPVLAVVFLAALIEVPVLFPVSTAPQDPGLLARRRPRGRVDADPAPTTLPDLAAPAPVPEVSQEPRNPDERPSAEPPAAAPALGPVAAKEQEKPVERPSTDPAAVAPVAAPVPVSAAPEIRPELVLEPTHLSFEEIDPVLTKSALLPQEPPPAAPAPVAQEFPGSDDDGSPLRIDRWQFGELPDRAGWWLGLLVRPLPDENDPEGLPPFEGRVDGFLLLGGGQRIPGLTLSLEIPLSAKNLVELSWTAADLPRAGDVDRGLSADWHHATLAFVHRLTGYTRNADFDLAISLGASMDLFGTVAGIPDPGGTPKFSPYAGLDMSFWQKNAIGLLLHLGESFPATIVGSSLGMTDFSAQIRWDLTERISLHGGYRVLLLRYRPDETAVPPGTDILHEGLSGPLVGLDIRF